MISQTFLDLSAMLLREQWDVSYDVKEVQSTMEKYFGREYSRSDVEEALDIIIAEKLNYPNNDYT